MDQSKFSFGNYGLSTGTGMYTYTREVQLEMEVKEKKARIKLLEDRLEKSNEIEEENEHLRGLLKLYL